MADVHKPRSREFNFKILVAFTRHRRQKIIKRRLIVAPRAKHAIRTTQLATMSGYIFCLTSLLSLLIIEHTISTNFEIDFSYCVTFQVIESTLIHQQTKSTLPTLTCQQLILAWALMVRTQIAVFNIPGLTVFELKADDPVSLFCQVLRQLWN